MSQNDEIRNFNDEFKNTEQSNLTSYLPDSQAMENRDELLVSRSNNFYLIQTV